MIYHPSIHISAPEDNYLVAPSDPAIGAHISADDAKQLAYHLAFSGLGYVAPNPLVGCVIVSADGRLLGRGAHQTFGGKHAEVIAIEDALHNFSNAKLQAATIYVTLQPCDHHGKTPPCTELIIRHRLAKVVYDLSDPNPNINSVETLQANGITVQRCEFNRDIHWLDEAYFWRYNQQPPDRPYVAMKIAATHNGMYAQAGQGRQWLTTVRARQYGHYLRQRYDAILVGRNTLELDNPMLNVRLPLQTLRHPFKIILAHPDKLATLERLQVLTHEPDKTIFVIPAGSHVSAKASRLLAHTLAVPSDDTAGYHLPSLLAKLQTQFGITSLLVEGGGKVWQSFWAAGVVDKLHLFQSNSETTSAKAQYWQQQVKLSTAHLSATRLVWLDADRLYEASCSYQGKERLAAARNPTLAHM
ncbi:MAG: bifunctional diaminohydroxyphosphoribosylaminopyrimidine deaminase/5-amino-6-(5-phosphoribosylamino)uracil reductase RibD [Pseudomonadota bacterium]|nr:bifunctional diaminohydroxyphosphoribosylaminopyrimidine deaminase/5-amino-6-(5-phosphoribosylamino)uracil reductase RibD [Pseudomonadota bacterium]